MFILYNNTIKQIDKDYLKISNQHYWKYRNDKKILYLNNCNDEIFTIFNSWFNDLKQIEIIKIPNNLLKYGVFTFNHVQLSKYNLDILQKLYKFAFTNQIELLINTLDCIFKKSDKKFYNYSPVIINLLLIPNLKIVELENYKKLPYKFENVDVLILPSSFDELNIQLTYQPYFVIESNDFKEIEFIDSFENYNQCIKYFHYTQNNFITLDDSCLNFIINYSNNLKRNQAITKETITKNSKLIFGNEKTINKIDISDKRFVQVSCIMLNDDLIYTDFFNKYFNNLQQLQQLQTFQFFNCPYLSKLSLNNISNINCRAMRNCTNLIDVELSDDITEIGDYAFSGCKNLKNIQLSNNILKINDWTFAGCSNLISINIPDKLTSIGDYAFVDCLNIVNIKLNDNILEIGDSAFKNCLKLVNINIPDKILRIKYCAFKNCISLRKLTIPDNVLISNYAFIGCSF